MSSILQKLKTKPRPQTKSSFTIKIGKETIGPGAAAYGNIGVIQELPEDIEETVSIAEPSGVEERKEGGDEEEYGEIEKGELSRRKYDTKQITVTDKTADGFDVTSFMETLKKSGLVIPTIVGSKLQEDGVQKPVTTTKTGFPIPIKRDGKMTSVTDTRDIGTTKTTSVRKTGKIMSVKRTTPLRIKKDAVIARAPLASFMIEGSTIKERYVPKKSGVLQASSYYMNNRKKFVEFINKFFKKHKEEIDSDKGDVSCETRKSGGDFESMPHQKIVKDYLSLYSPYRGLLLYHGLGSGKTCSSIGIAEGLKSRNQIVIMTPASLRMNYYEQLKQCGDILYKKNQYWQFINTDIHPEYIEPLSGLLNLKQDFIKNNKGAWLVNMTKESNFNSLTTDEVDNLNKQLNKMIEAKYQFINYNGLRKASVDKLSKNGTENPFDNKVVIVDEAHNFISRIVNKIGKRGKSDSISIRLYEFLLSAKNCRVVLLTGTPIINYPNEIGVLFNILRGYIKTWHIPLNIRTDAKINEQTLKQMFERVRMLDHIEYKPSSKTLIVTKNPFGFVNKNLRVTDKESGKKRVIYNGVNLKSIGKDKPVADLEDYNLDSNEIYSDEAFEKSIYSILGKNGIDVVDRGVRVEMFKALPDTFDGFKNLFIQENGDIVNSGMFKNRIVGLTSYFRSAQEALLPKYDKSKDNLVEHIPMSDYQFAIYEVARQAERKEAERNAKKKRKRSGGEDNIASMYDDATSTYRIFSRAFCNFVFPEETVRPLPKEEDDINTAVMKLDEDDIDNKDIKERIDNPDGLYSTEDITEIEANMEVREDTSYEERIKKALQFLKDNSERYLVGDNLETYSPKFKRVLENIQDSLSDDTKNGLHLIYSQFRTLEGIGILSIVLEANGFTKFRVKKDGEGVWRLDIPDKDMGKPMYALYTGTETSEEKEIIRNVFNSTWEYVPSSITNALNNISRNNYRGEIIKVLMITASGAEGIDLKNIRHVHLIEPYWHPVRWEQVIGRAVRICSHKDLPEELRDVTVYQYLMTFTEDQKLKNRELRLKDVSKIDKVTPLTSDEALYEISNMKENITNKILKLVKESSIDCEVYDENNKKEGLVCLSYGDGVSTEQMSYTPNYKTQRTDKDDAINVRKIEWKGKKMSIGTKTYVLRMKEDGKTPTDKVYEYDSYIAAIKTPGVTPKYIGRLVKKDRTYTIVPDRM